MKILFIEARSSADIVIGKNHLKKLPKNLALATTIQHVHKIKELKEHLEKNNKKIILLKGRHSKYSGQILGCDFDMGTDINKKTIKNIDAILYVGTGSFHPVDLAIKSGKEVFVYNPADKVLSRIDNEDIDKAKKRRKGALIRFLSSKEIGVLVSVKPGQYNIKKAMELEKKYKHKNFYYFLFDTIDINELENFPFIECFVNTACPRIADDCGSISKPLVNIEEIIYIKFKYS